MCSFRFTSQIDSRGVIQLILQNLQENNLTESYNTLAKETRVDLRVLRDRQRNDQSPIEQGAVSVVGHFWEVGLCIAASGSGWVVRRGDFDADASEVGADGSVRADLL